MQTKKDEDEEEAAGENDSTQPTKKNFREEIVIVVVNVVDEEEESWSDCMRVALRCVATQNETVVSIFGRQEWRRYGALLCRVGRSECDGCIML